MNQMKIAGYIILVSHHTLDVINFKLAMVKKQLANCVDPKLYYLFSMQQPISRPKINRARATFPKEIIISDDIYSNFSNFVDGGKVLNPGNKIFRTHAWVMSFFC